MTVAMYPADLEADTMLRDGTTVRLRAVRPDEATAVLALFDGLSERSLYYRFMTARRLDLSDAQKIANVDYVSPMVLVAERGDALCGLAGSAASGRRHRRRADPGGVRRRRVLRARVRSG